MRADRIGSAGGGPSRVVAAEPAWPGRIDVKERAVRKVAEEASARTIGVDRSDISVEIAEYGGGIALRLATPLPIPDLGDTAAVAAATPVLERVAGLQRDLQSTIAQIVGRDVTRINITVTGATVPPRRRVR
jgi:hypothetical protein